MRAEPYEDSLSPTRRPMVYPNILYSFSENMFCRPLNLDYCAWFITDARLIGRGAFHVTFEISDMTQRDRGLVAGVLASDGFRLV